MSVELDPAELGFKRLFSHEVSEVLRLKNPNSEPLAFKVKTTAPKQYCVRPNSGRIEPGEVVEVSVLLQAMKEDPPVDYKCRDKFLVQTVLISAAQELPNVSAIWANIEQTAKSSIQEKKIRVNFLPLPGLAGAGHMSTPSRSSVIGTSHEEELPAYSSPFSTANTPIHRNTVQNANAPVATFESMSTGTRAVVVGEVREGAFDLSSLHQPHVPANVLTAETQLVHDSPAESQGVVADVVDNVVETIASIMPSAEDVHAGVEQAKATIANLTGQADQGLRQRRNEAVSHDATRGGQTTMGMQHAPPSGVPVPMVAALCLMCFLIAYLLF